MSSKVVFINGAPATGKTTFLATLKDAALPVFILSKDEIAEQLFQTTPPTKDSGVDVEVDAMEMIIRQLEQRLKAGDSCIFEAPLYPQDRNILEALLSQHQTECLQILLTCNAKQLLQRDAERRRNGTRNALHRPLRPERIAYHLDNIRHLAIPQATSVTLRTDLPSFPTEKYTEIQWQISDFLTSK